MDIIKAVLKYIFYTFLTIGFTIIYYLIINKIYEI